MKTKSQLILELTEIHAQLRHLHQDLMDQLVLDGDMTIAYAEKSLVVLQYQTREAEIVWQLTDLLTLERN